MKDDPLKILGLPLASPIYQIFKTCITCPKNASSQRNLIILKDYLFHMLNLLLNGLEIYIHPEFGIERLSRWSNFGNLGSKLVLFLCKAFRNLET